MDRDVLVGRERELADLERRLVNSRAVGGAVVFCEGDAGMGKTALAAELARRAREQGFGVAWGACPEGEGSTAYRPWVQVVSALGRAVGDLITPAADDNASRFRLFADVVEVLRGASAENGLLVVLDHQPRRRRNPYNTRQPADDVANNLGPWSQLLEKGGYSPAEAKEAALQFLPDILRFDRTNPWATPTDGS